MNQKVITRAAEIIRAKTGGGTEFCTLALIDENGYPTASTLAISKADGIKWITFCTSISSNKAKRIAKCNRGSVCVNSSEYNISLVGSLEIITDPKVKKEMWYEGLEHYWPAGPDEPDYCVLRFNTERYNLAFDDCEEAAGAL